MENFFNELGPTLDKAEKKLREIKEENTCLRQGPGAWSSKEILGHLVDSSYNNIIRFIEGQLKDDLIFSGYNQDKWVKAQNYQDAEWNFIIDLWRLNNLQILRVLRSMPTEVLKKMNKSHNYNDIAFKELSADQQSNLEYLVLDYFDHMKHHLNRIFLINSIEQLK